MKSIHLITFLLFSFSGFFAKAESLPTYTVGKEKKETSLNSNQSLFRFIIKDRNTDKIISTEIKFACNGKQSKLRSDKSGKSEYRTTSGKYVLEFFIHSDYYEIKTDSIPISKGCSRLIQLFFKSAVIPIMEEKPVIYLYSDSVQEVNLRFKNPSLLKFTYPEYKNEWRLTTMKDGKLKIDGKTLDYLFWEGNANFSEKTVTSQEGFLIKGNETVKFLDQQLSFMGLNEREKEDFITYWAPRMINNKYNKIKFLFTDEISVYAPIEIQPKPQQFFRVFMIFQAASADEKVQGQILPQIQRNGLTVIEWGGAEVNKDHF
jgi:hypothetical protein